MRKLVFLFMSRSSAYPGSTKRVIPNWNCEKYYIDNFRDECYFKMLEELLRQNVFDELKIFYESNLGAGLAQWISDSKLQDRIYGEVIPEIRFVKDYIDDNSVIFVRGGFKHWHDLLFSYKNKNWLMIYAANTGRDKWTWWDIVLNDCGNRNFYIDRHERFYFKFTKPTNEERFYFKNIKPIYDICIGASHIHDRKGQYLVVRAIEELNKQNFKVNAVLPGSPRGGNFTIQMMRKLDKIDNISYAGYLNKGALCQLFNESKLFVHMGNHGQNDRSIFEALACGTPIIYKSLQHHDSELNKYFFRFEFENDVSKLAYEIKSQLLLWNQNQKINTLEKYQQHFGFNKVVIPKMKKLIEFMFENRPNMEAKRQLTNLFKGY